jgi:hypothetical protein
MPLRPTHSFTRNAAVRFAKRAWGGFVFFWQMNFLFAYFCLIRHELRLESWLRSRKGKPCC